jgi:hypothetical protein
MMESNREVTYDGILKTSETYSIQQSAYIGFFDLTDCGHCEIDSYVIADIEGDHTILITDGTITTVMPSQALSTSFNLVP